MPLQEFRVITNNFNAEFGRNTGAIVDVVTKSGTNTFHGGVYEFGRWNAFGGARDWFNRTDEGRRIPMCAISLAIASAGRSSRTKPFSSSTRNFKDFAPLDSSSDRANSRIQDWDLHLFWEPIDLTQGGANNGTGNAFFGDPAANAPADPTMQKVFALYPNPTIDNGDGLTGTLFYPSNSKQNSYQTVAKIDHHLTDRETVSLRYGYDGFVDPNPAAVPIFGNVSSKSLGQGLAANLTSTLTSNVINSFTFGWNRIYANFGCDGVGVVDSAIPSTDQFGNGWDIYPGSFSDFGCSALAADGQWRTTGTTSYSDSLSWSHGNHTLKFGGDFRNVGQKGPNNFFSRRQVTTSGLLLGFGVPVVQNIPADLDDLTLEEAAQSYYGIVENDLQAQFFDKTGARQATDNKHFRQHEYDWFGQDTWKVRRNLTVTLGLRYQLDGVPYEEGANFSNLLGDPLRARSRSPLLARAPESRFMRPTIPTWSRGSGSPGTRAGTARWRFGAHSEFSMTVFSATCSGMPAPLRLLKRTTTSFQSTRSMGSMAAC